MKRLYIIVFLLAGCSPKIQTPSAESLKPSWLSGSANQEGYYTGIGHSTKTGSNNYVQAAKKSALDDLVSEIKVNVSSTSILNQTEVGKKLTEQYEQIIKTTAADEIEDFELVGSWEDATNYWVYYRLSVARYRQIKEEQKRNATILSKDFLLKGREEEKQSNRLQALSYYFQALRAVEKYLGEAIPVNVEGRDVLLGNEIYASLQRALNNIQVRVQPSHIQVNRRVGNASDPVVAAASFADNGSPAVGLALRARFVKGSGDVFPTYKTDEKGQAKILISKIGSKELEQTVGVVVDIDALSGNSESPIYSLVVDMLNLPGDNVVLGVERPVVYLTTDEKSFGLDKQHNQIANRLKNLLVNNGFEFTDSRQAADLWCDIKSDAEKGAVTGSIYVTYLTSVIKILTVKEGREIYATTLDRVKGYGLDYDKSSTDAYNKAIEALEKERINELLNTVLQ